MSGEEGTINVVDDTMAGEVQPDWTMVMIYGILADAMVILPVLFYMIFDSNSMSRHH